MAATKNASKATETAAVAEVAPESTDTVTDVQVATEGPFDPDELGTILNAIVHEDDDDTSVFVAPVRDADWTSTGEIQLERKLSRHAQSNVMDLALTGNTPEARYYWYQSLVRAGVITDNTPYGVTV